MTRTESSPTATFWKTFQESKLLGSHLVSVKVTDWYWYCRHVAASTSTIRDCGSTSTWKYFYRGTPRVRILTSTGTALVAVPIVLCTVRFTVPVTVPKAPVQYQSEYRGSTSQSTGKKMCGPNSTSHSTTAVPVTVPGKKIGDQTVPVTVPRQYQSQYRKKNLWTKQYQSQYHGSTSHSTAKNILGT